MAQNNTYLRKYSIILSFFLLFSFLSGKAAHPEEWEEKKSTHFIVYSQPNNTTARYLRKVIRKAEEYYKDITDYLGFVRFDFWKWEDRCKIYIYPDRQSYSRNSQLPGWSSGRVHIKTKEISTFVRKRKFLNYILPHELGHIVFREFVGFNKNIPLWLDEGIAVLQEKNRQAYIRTAKKLIQNDTYLTINQLSHIRRYQDISPKVFYSEAASIVEFLLKNFGRDHFVDFCRELRNESGWKEPLKSVYRFDNIAQFEQQWKNWLLDQ